MMVEKTLIDDSFVCIVSKVDSAAKIVIASVYDSDENVQVMSIEASFSSFGVEDQDLIAENVIFDWQIGTRQFADGTKENFSEFKIKQRLPRTAEEEAEVRRLIEEQVKRFEEVFSD